MLLLVVPMLLRKRGADVQGNRRGMELALHFRRGAPHEGLPLLPEGLGPQHCHFSFQEGLACVFRACVCFSNAHCVLRTKMFSA